MKLTDAYFLSNIKDEDGKNLTLELHTEKDIKSLGLSKLYDVSDNEILKNIEYDKKNKILQIELDNKESYVIGDVELLSGKLKNKGGK